MRIESYLNCSQQLIEAKKYNIFIWISLGNKYFSKENIEKYILWALDNTKTNVVILLADLIHAINYEVFNKYNKDRAIKIAMKKSLELQQIVQDIINNLPSKQRNLVNIATWDNYRNTQNYINLLPLILNEFDNNIDFHDYIINIIKTNLGDRIIRLSEERIEKLVYYTLDELPILINWFEYNWILYNLHPYPWLSKLDDLWIWIREKRLFPVLWEILNINKNIAQVELYVD